MSVSQLWMCKICFVQKYSRQSLWSHVKAKHGMHASVKALPCLYHDCVFSFRTLSSLSSHLSRHHAYTNNTEEVQRCSLQCLHCGILVSCVRAYLVPLRVHVHKCETVFRVELPDGNARKLDTEAKTVRELQTDIHAKLDSNLPDTFLLHYYDGDFGNYFTLDSDEDIQDKWPALFRFKAMEFLHVTNVSARRVFYANLDDNTDVLLSIVQQRGSASGRLVQAQLSKLDSITDASQLVSVKRDIIMFTVPIYLGEDLSDLYHFLQDDSDKNRSAYIRQGDSGWSVVIEAVDICTEETVCEAMLALFMCHYIFNLHYSSNKLFHQFIQLFLLGIYDDDRKMPPKLRSLINKISTVSA